MNDYDRIARVIEFLGQHHSRQPSLSELAGVVDLSPHHFHRMFSRWAGVTPKSFLQCLTLARAKQALEAGNSVLDASLDAGLSGPGRLHDLCVKLEAASPGEMKTGGEGWTIRAGFAESPFGLCCLGESPRGICYLAFVAKRDRSVAELAIKRDWPLARVYWDRATVKRVTSVFSNSPEADLHAPLRMFVRGTEFQVRVWRALLRIPRGTLASYGHIAETLGDRAAARAVGTAIGKNRLAYLIPCHRVIRETGLFSDYRWGRTRKQAIIAWEGSARK